MPTSHPRQLNEIVELVMMTKPASVLEVGVGFGKYGYLTREYLEFWDGREDYVNRRYRIDGIEAFEQYITPLQRQVYDEIFIGDALDVLPRLERRYDLILIVDVLEHFTREDGLRLLDECLRVARNVLVATPVNHLEQGDVYGNAFEQHRYGWKRADFDRYPNRFFPRNVDSLIAYLGEDASRVRPEYEWSQRRQAIAKLAPWARVVPRVLRGLRGREN